MPCNGSARQLLLSRVVVKVTAAVSGVQLLAWKLAVVTAVAGGQWLSPGHTCRSKGECGLVRRSRLLAVMVLFEGARQSKS
jgi:hypothetical protein